MMDFDFLDNWRSDDGQLFLQGHRGARGHMAENTLESFAYALQNGCTSVELDLLATKDDVLVVTHNPIMLPSFTKDANNHWIGENEYSIRDMTYDAVKKMNVGSIDPDSDYGKTFSKQTSLPKGTIPTLEDVFQLFQQSEFQTAWVNIEVKSDPTQPHLTMPIPQLVETLSDLIEQYAMNRRVVIQSFDWNVCLSMQSHNPTLATSYLTEIRYPWSGNANVYNDSPWLAKLCGDVDFCDGFDTTILPKIIKEAGGKMWSPYYQDTTPENVQYAKDLGLLVYPWTLNETQWWEKHRLMNVDGIITDYPKDAMAYLQSLQQ